eukprot:6184529-Pleurochrysis_carterae.AAC.1
MAPCTDDVYVLGGSLSSHAVAAWAAAAASNIVRRMATIADGTLILAYFLAGSQPGEGHGIHSIAVRYMS